MASYIVTKIKTMINDNDLYISQSQFVSQFDSQFMAHGLFMEYKVMGNVPKKF